MMKWANRRVFMMKCISGERKVGKQWTNRSFDAKQWGHCRVEFYSANLEGHFVGVLFRKVD